jgi:serine/threonine protein kinase
LVLEWVPKGSLSDLLADSMAAAGVGGALRWDEQLLTLAQDVARGMAYLHGREYLDEVDGSKRQCILHRFVSSPAAFPPGAASHLLLPASSCGAL